MHKQRCTRCTRNAQGCMRKGHPRAAREPKSSCWTSVRFMAHCYHPSGTGSPPHPAPKVSTPTHTKHPDWYLEFEFRVKAQALPRPEHHRLRVAHVQRLLPASTAASLAPRAAGGWPSARILSFCCTLPLPSVGFSIGMERERRRRLPAAGGWLAGLRDGFDAGLGDVFDTLSTD